MPSAGRYTGGWRIINKDMKKIMFNDKYGLTKAVLEGRKTITRRVIKAPRTMEGKDVNGFSVVKYHRTGVPIEVMALDADGAQINNIFPTYKVGEVVAVAQSYGTILDELEDPLNFSCMEHWESKSGDRAKYAELAMYSPGGNNKMFVCADEMPHQIRITNVRLERLQDISDDDCLLEGVERIDNDDELMYKAFDTKGGFVYSTTPRGAFIALIDKVFDNGTWALNPWVFVYEFELVK
jgi:hypothetical protein